MADTLEAVRNCHNCGAFVPLGALACEKCHALLHSEELARISMRANSMEESGRLQEAKDEWTKALSLLPSNATQADWVRSKLRALALLRDATPLPDKNNWAKKLGPLGPIAILLAKSKVFFAALFKLKFLLSLLTFMAVYWSLYGIWFGAGFVLLIFVHEMGHYIDIRRRGLPAEMPIFLPGLGAYVKWEALGVTRVTRAAVSLAGPIAGFLGAAVCLFLWYRTGNGLWQALARSSAWLNILNLIPVWVLDGGQAANALSKTERWLLLGLSLLLWLGFGEGLFFLVAAGFVYRLFTKDLPPAQAPRISVYYAVVLVLLGAILYLVPGKAFGPT
jgi:Zn-dependent protease